MKSLTHKKCLGTRGIITFKCIRCGNESSNYMNGVKICHECCKETHICQICGKSLIGNSMYRNKL